MYVSRAMRRVFISVVIKRVLKDISKLIQMERGNRKTVKRV